MSRVGLFPDIPGIDLENGSAPTIWSENGYVYQYDYQYEGHHEQIPSVLPMKMPYPTPALIHKRAERSQHEYAASYVTTSPCTHYLDYHQPHNVHGLWTPGQSPTTLSADDIDIDSDTTHSQVFGNSQMDEQSSAGPYYELRVHDDSLPSWSMAPTNVQPFAPFHHSTTFVDPSQVYPDNEQSSDQTPILVEHCMGGASTLSPHAPTEQDWVEAEAHDSPMEMDYEDHSTPESFDDIPSDDDDPPYSPSKSKASQKQRKSSSGQKRSKIAVQRQAAHRRASCGTTSTSVKSITGARGFPCLFAHYGCGATFLNKNEWKRHSSTQHVKLGFWRCDLCPTTPATGYNDFNRKDLFTQHLKRMHRQHIVEKYDPALMDMHDDVNSINDKDLKEATEPLVVSCWQQLRQLPTKCRCLFCDRSFKGVTAWESRLDHLAGHLEKYRKTGAQVPGTHEWKEDQDLEVWLVEEGLIEMSLKGKWQIGEGKPMRIDEKIRPR